MKANPYYGGQLTLSGAIAGDIQVNLQTGAVVSASANASVQDMGNGWYVISITDVAASTSLVVKYTVFNDATFTSYTGDGTSNVLMWGTSLIVPADMSNYAKTLIGWVGWDGIGQTVVGAGINRSGITAVSVLSGGLGYAVDDVLTVDGGTLFGGAPAATVKVTSVDGSGAVTGVAVWRGSGNYTTTTGATATTSGGTGTGCTINTTWSIKGAALPASMAMSSKSCLDMADPTYGIPAIAAKRYLLTPTADGGRQWTFTDGGVR
jgi:hypothetical protein